MRRSITLNEFTTDITSHSTPAPSLAALGVKLPQLRRFEPIDRLVQIAQKTVKQSPTHKLSDGCISLLAGAHGMVEVHTRRRADPSLQAAFGRSACAEQSVGQQTLDASTSENVTQMEQAMNLMDRLHRRAFRHDYQQDWQSLDVDLSGWLCGKQAAFASKGYVALTQRNRRGRQLGRVLATRYQEVVVDRLFAGNRQRGGSLQELIQAAQVTLELSEAQRAQTLVRTDAGGGSMSNFNWLFEQGYHILGKACSAPQSRLLAKTVKEWVTDAQLPERHIGWVTQEALDFIRPVRRVAVRCLKPNGQWGIGVLVCSLPTQAILRLSGLPVPGSEEDHALLQAVVALYDQRGGGIETSFKGDKQGLDWPNATTSGLKLSKSCWCWGAWPTMSWSGRTTG